MHYASPKLRFTLLSKERLFLRHLYRGTSKSHLLEDAPGPAVRQPKPAILDGAECKATAGELI